MELTNKQWNKIIENAIKKTLNESTENGYKISKEDEELITRKEYEFFRLLKNIGEKYGLESWTLQMIKGDLDDALDDWFKGK